jgi:hypothetical protein
MMPSAVISRGSQLGDVWRASSGYPAFDAPRSGAFVGRTNHREEQIVPRKLCQLRSIQAFVAAAATAVAMLCAGGTAAASMPAGYQMRVFAAGGSSLSGPDDLTQLGGWIYVVDQNATQPDGSTGGASNVVAYRRNGTVARTWSVTRSRS